MFDVNNVYVSAYNHGFDPSDYVRGIPHERVVQIHLAGHTNLGKYIIDTHRGHVAEPVWDLYQEAIELCGPVSTLIEWDDEIPEFDVLSAEAERARVLRNRALEARPEKHRDEATPRRRGVPAPEPAASASPMWAQGGPRELPDEATPLDTP
jgi:uncharacterized protein (UPF0276 family)